VTDYCGGFPSCRSGRRGELRPTLKQLEGYARATYTPVGLLLLPEPPGEPVPIPDFRTIADHAIARPSANLLDTVYLCEQRQEWYRDYARAASFEAVPSMGALSTNRAVVEAADTIRSGFGFDLDQRAQWRTWSETLPGLAERAEEAGVLVMASGVVGSNPHRKLDPREFRGFALADDLAPIVFINAVDTKAAQIFTLAHELAHIWLGQTALDDAEAGVAPSNEIESWCNQLAAELLVPMPSLLAEYDASLDLAAEIQRLARSYKVSTLVVLRRIHDAGRMSWEQYRAAYLLERDRVMAMVADRASSGGDFYDTAPVRASKRFARALVASTLEGQTLFRDAARMLGLKKVSTLEALGHRLGVA
jgi:Zn-dependent peptidase ImmA (M78 family)